MTITTDAGAVTRSINAQESWTLSLRGISFSELGVIDKIVKAHGTVDEDKTMWGPFVGEDGAVLYTIVFKSSAHVNQHKLTLADEVFEATGIRISTN